MNTKRFRVALVQYHASGQSIGENTEKACEFIRQAAAEQADMVLFTECFLTTYQFPAICETLPPLEEIRRDPSFAAWRNAAIADEDPHLAKIRALAGQLQIGVVITAFSRGRQLPRNTAWVIGRDGSILLKYSKVHTCDFSDEQYLESARQLMLGGAELILVPNDCQTMGPRLRELSVRAMENMVGIAMANPPGEQMGCSCAYDPMVWDEDGLALENEKFVAAPHFEGLACVDFDMEAIRQYRQREDLGKYRKPMAYRRK